jgi:hypothetical protein
MKFSHLSIRFKLLNLATKFNHLIMFELILIIICHLGLVIMFNDVK